MNYRFETTEDLIGDYAFQSDADTEMARIEMELIKDELKRRFRAMLRKLDDVSTIENPQGTYNVLLGK